MSTDSNALRIRLFTFEENMKKLSELIAKAAVDNADAQHELGHSFLYGENGLPKDPKTGAAWIRKAAEQNHANAQLELGNLLVEGRGVDEDRKGAHEWFRKAAENGNPNAQFFLGMAFLTVSTYDGVKDEEQGLMWLKRAADKNPGFKRDLDLEEAKAKKAAASPKT